MFKELFLVIKINEDESANAFSMRQKQLICEVLAHCACGLDACKCAYIFDKKRPLIYVLILLPEEIDSDTEKSLKHEVLEGRFAQQCDVLFSEKFPCFNEQCKDAGALVMDMDMTTVQIEGIDEIARCLNVFDDVAAITAEAMHGKLDFAQSLTKRVALLKGGNANEVLPKVKEIMVETDGLDELLNYCNELKRHQEFKTCIASGGFHELIGVIKDRYGLDEVRANSLGVDEKGLFTGKVASAIVDAQAKADLVNDLMKSGIKHERVIVLGDGANDLKMIGQGGLGIAYHAKPKVQQEARNVLNIGTLAAVKALLELKSHLN